MTATDRAIDWLVEPDETIIDARLRTASRTDPALAARLARAHHPRWVALDRWLDATDPAQRAEVLQRTWQDHRALADSLGADGWHRVANAVERGSFRRLLRAGTITGVASRRQIRFVLFLVVPLIAIGIVFQMYDNVLAIHLSRWVCTIAGVAGLVYVGPAMYAEARAEVVEAAVAAATASRTA